MTLAAAGQPTERADPNWARRLMPGATALAAGREAKDRGPLCSTDRPTLARRCRGETLTRRKTTQAAFDPHRHRPRRLETEVPRPGKAVSERPDRRALARFAPAHYKPKGLPGRKGNSPGDRYSTNEEQSLT